MDNTVMVGRYRIELIGKKTICPYQLTLLLLYD